MSKPASRGKKINGLIRMAETPMRQTLMQALQMEDWIDRLGKPVGKVPYAGTSC